MGGNPASFLETAARTSLGSLVLGGNSSHDQLGIAGRLGDMAQPGLDGLRTVAQADAWKWMALFLRLEAKLNNTRVFTWRMSS